MKKLSILDSVKSIGKVVELYGWVSTIRDHKKIVFVDLKDKTGVVQLVGSDKLADVGVGSVIKISGKVKERPLVLCSERGKRSRARLICCANQAGSPPF